MTKYRVMFIGQGASGLPEDRFVNTFHFWDAATHDPAKLEAAMDAVENFYLGMGTGMFGRTNNVSKYLSPYLNRNAELRGYNLDEAGTGPGTGNPRTPTIRTMALGAAGAAAGLPEEVAVCLSYSGAPPAGPRRRGRIYLGPLVTTVLDAATSAVPARPNTTFIQNLKIAGAELAANVGPSPRWCIRSTVPDENFVPIAFGYVDDAFDTQRRRGVDPTSRQTWEPPVG